MVDMCKIIKCFPIQVNNKTIDLLNYDDIPWYLENIKQKYYNKYIDVGYKKEYNDSVYIGYFKDIVYNMRFNTDTLRNISEIRLIIKDLHNRYGSITIFCNNNIDIDIAYFINPEFQRKGICSKSLHYVIETLLNKSDIQINKIQTIIREDNEASIKMVKSLGFKYLTEYEGEHRTNKIYYIGKGMLK